MDTEKNADLILLESEILKMTSKDIKPMEVGEINWSEHSENRMVNAGFVYRDIIGQFVDGKLRFHCRLDLWNRLLLPNGSALSAKGVAYFFSGIQWRAGVGWPFYSNRCPLSDSSPVMTFPTAKRHQLIVQFGGFAWTECANSNAGVGNQVTDVFVGVNDDKYDDNTGSFEFIITSYSI